MRPLKHIAVALLCFAAVYVVIMYGLCRVPYKGKPAVFITNDYLTWKGGDTYAKFKEFDPKKKYDVVVLGSSRAYRGYSPAVFEKHGLNMFNLGTSAQSIRNTYFVAKHYLDSTNTKLLIIDVFTGAFRASQLESSSDLVENISQPAAAYDIAQHTGDIRALNMAVVRRFTESQPAYFTKKDYTGRGFSEKRDSLPKFLRKRLLTFKQPATASIQIPASELAYFDQLLTLCNERHIRIVVVNSPVSDFYSLVDHKIFLDAIQPIMTKHNVKFLDYSRKLPLSTVDNFYDDTHMNLSGVEIFNEALVGDL